MTERTFGRLLIVLVAALAALHLPLIFRLNINWDEFLFLADVYRFHAGTLVSALQTIHVHAFSWLPYAGADEVEQVIAARFVYYILLLASCGFVYLIARRFMPMIAALFVLLCYLSYSNIIAHATSFRFDGLAVFLLLGAVAVLVRMTSARIAPVISGILAAIAMLVTIKSGFYIPTLVLILLLRRPNDRAYGLALFVLSFALSIGLLYTAHRAGLTTTGIVNPADMLQQSISRGIRLDALFMGRKFLLLTIVANVVIWSCIVYGIVITASRVLYRDEVAESLMLLALLVPFASVVIYRNAFPYFYVFLMPPVLVLSGIPFARIVAKMGAGGGRTEAALGLALISAVAATFAAHYSKHSADEIKVERAVVRAVHYMFPKPVSYIDRNSMIASFPKVGFFMSTWGFTNYLEKGRPIFENVLKTHAPRFLIANHPALILDGTISVPAAPGQNRLMKEDFRVLSENFVPHWGPVWVAGKRVNIASDFPTQVEVLIPGVYTLESSQPVAVDNTVFRPGDTVALAKGWHFMQSTAGKETITLRWGVRLPRPVTPPPVGILYRDF